MLRFLVCKQLRIYMMILIVLKIHNNDLQISLSIGVYAGIYIAQNYEVCYIFDKIKSYSYN